MGGPGPSGLRIPRHPSKSLVVHRLGRASTPELAAELYRRLCVGLDGQPGPYRGTVLELCLTSLSEAPATRGAAARSPPAAPGSY